MAKKRKLYLRFSISTVSDAWMAEWLGLAACPVPPPVSPGQWPVAGESSGPRERPAGRATAHCPLPNTLPYTFTLAKALPCTALPTAHFCQGGEGEYPAVNV